MRKKLLASASAMLFLLAGCGQEVTLNPTSVEIFLSNNISFINVVECPPAMSGSVGKVFDCAMYDTAVTDPGKNFPIWVAVRIESEGFSWRAGEGNWNRARLD